MSEEEKDYMTAYLICLEKIGKANDAMRDLAESRQRLKETLEDIRKIYRIRYGKDIKESLDA